MPVKRRDSSLSRRYYWNFALLGLLAAACGVLAWSDYASQRSLRLLALVGAAGTVAIGLIRSELLFRCYRCPNCGRRISQVSHSPGAPIEYACKDCDTLWETGFNVPTD